MNRPEPQDISPGTVLEFFESKEILCGVVLAVKDGRFHVLSEKNREITLSRSRVIHHGMLLDPKRGRDELVKELSEISAARKHLTEQIDLEEAWSLFESDDGEFHSHEIAEFLFPTPVEDTSAAAVNRALLQDRLYFVFRDGRFSPRSPDAVDQRRIELQKEAELERKLGEGAKWIEALLNRKNVPPPAFRDELIDALKEFSLFSNEAKDGAFIKELLRRASLPPQPQTAFRALVRLGVWNEDENLLLHENGITPSFPEQIENDAKRIAATNHLIDVTKSREDLTGLAAFTVDSSLTRDYDDALSVRQMEDGAFEVGIHIADAAEFVSRDDPLDKEAAQRVSSIYLPDDRISMFPPVLSEGAFSLKAGEDRLALSFLLQMDADANILESRIVPTVVRIKDQLTYHDVDSRLPGDNGLSILYELARKLRQKRLERGAIILPLPEINISVNSAGMIQVTRYEKETPSQVLVSEWMIAANAAAADYLADNGVPAIFRGQAECRPETEFVKSEYELFAVYRQRRLFSRAELSPVPKAHCSLALSNYTTVTSPIRRYSDLVVQRQLKSALAGNPGLYSRDEIEQIITTLSVAQGRIFTIQRKWTRYWLLKYIEQEDLETMNALVLDKNARFAHLLIPDLFLEINAPIPENPKFRQGEMVRLRIDKINPREDMLKGTILDSPAR